jgi:hypothetical protein
MRGLRFCQQILGSWGRMVCCVTALTLVVSFNAGAQDSLRLRQWAVRLVPFKLVDPFNPGLEFQLERQLSNRLSVQLSGAWLFNGLSTNYVSLNGGRGLLGMKYFMDREHGRKTHSHSYVMLEGGTGVSIHRRDDFFVPRSDTLGERRIDRYRTNKQSTYATVRLGTEVIFSERWTGDFSFGLGVKYRRVRHSERDFPDYVMSLDKFDSTFSGLVEGESLWINFPCALGIGYRFGRRQ